MFIPEDQLETWSRQGAISSSSATYASIQGALKRHTFPPQTTFDIYLQGSYKNDTNVRGDSDVDIVVELTSTFYRDTTDLTALERLGCEASFPNASYTLHDFNRDVLSALRANYGTHNVIQGKKAIRVQKDSVPLNADIIVALKYRKFSRFTSNNAAAQEGITFFISSENRWVVNYPSLHYNNGVFKNSIFSTNGWFKPVVRMFKNARGYMVDKGLIRDGLSSSYFIECLFYNVPNDKFGNSYRNTYFNSCMWLKSADIGSFLCQHGQGSLCRHNGFEYGPDQWPLYDARNFIQQLAYLWDNW